MASSKTKQEINQHNTKVNTSKAAQKDIYEKK